MHVAGRDCSSTFWFPHFWSWATLMMFNTERLLCSTKFGIVTLDSNHWIGISVGGWFVRPRGYHQLSINSSVPRLIMRCWTQYLSTDLKINYIYTITGPKIINFLKLRLTCQCGQILADFNFHFYVFFFFFFVYRQVRAAPDISFLMPAAVVFHGTCRLRWLSGGRLPSMGCILGQASLAWCLRLVCLLDCISCCVLGRGCMLLAHQTFRFQAFRVEPHW